MKMILKQLTACCIHKADEPESKNDWNVILRTGAPKDEYRDGLGILIIQSFVFNVVSICSQLKTFMPSLFMILSPA